MSRYPPPGFNMAEAGERAHRPGSLRLGGRGGDRSVARHRVELVGPPKGLGAAGGGGGGAVGRMGAVTTRPGGCDFLCFAYSPLGPVVAVHSSIDHCYVLWISEVYLHVKRAQILLFHAQNSYATQTRRIRPRIDFGEQPARHRQSNSARSSRRATRRPGATMLRRHPLLPREGETVRRWAGR